MLIFEIYILFKLINKFINYKLRNNYNGDWGLGDRKSVV